MAEYPLFSWEWLLFLLESEYQSKKTVNETQRDAKVALLLIDQWLVQGLKSLTGLISSNVRGSLTTAPFRENIAGGHSYSSQIKNCNRKYAGLSVSLFGAIIPSKCCCFSRLANRCRVQSARFLVFFPQLQLRAIKDLVHNWSSNTLNFIQLCCWKMKRNTTQNISLTLMRVAISALKTGLGLTCQRTSKPAVLVSLNPLELMGNYWLRAKTSQGAGVQHWAFKCSPSDTEHA